MTPLAAHKGMRKTLQNLMRFYTWFKMYEDVRDYIKRCANCQRIKIQAGKREMVVRDMPNLWEIISIDLMGPYTESKKKNKYALVICDVASKFSEIIPLQKATSQIIVDHLFKIFCRYGFPKNIISDNGPQFISEIYDSFCQKFNCKIDYIIPYHQQSNPAERLIKEAKEHIQMYLADRGNTQNWDEHLDEFIFSNRHNINNTTGFSPAKLMFGRDFDYPQITQPFKDRVQQKMRNISYLSDPEVLKAKLADRESNYALAKANYEVAKVTQKANYDSQNKALLRTDRFKINDLVLLETHILSDKFRKVSAGLKSRFEGPYIISFIFPNGTYQLNDNQSGKCICKAHFNQLKPFNKCVDDSISLEKPSHKSAKIRGRRPGQQTSLEHRNVSTRDSDRYAFRPYRP